MTAAMQRDDRPLTDEERLARALRQGDIDTIRALNAARRKRSS